MLRPDYLAITGNNDNFDKNKRLRRVTLNDFYRIMYDNKVILDKINGVAPGGLNGSEADELPALPASGAALDTMDKDPLENEEGDEHDVPFAKQSLGNPENPNDMDIEEEGGGDAPDDPHSLRKGKKKKGKKGKGQKPQISPRILNILDISINPTVLRRPASVK